MRRSGVRSSSAPPIFTLYINSLPELRCCGVRWSHCHCGQNVTEVEEETDTVFLYVSGLSGLDWAQDGGSRLVTEIAPGRLIGDLAVIQNDAMVATRLLRSVGGHLTNTTSRLSTMRAYAVERGVDFANLDGPIDSLSEEENLQDL